MTSKWKELPEHRKQNVTCAVVFGVFCVFALCCGVCWFGSVVGTLVGR